MEGRQTAKKYRANFFSGQRIVFQGSEEDWVPQTDGNLHRSSHSSAPQIGPPRKISIHSSTVFSQANNRKGVSLSCKKSNT